MNRYLVALAGPPGAGKSTVANEVVWRLNYIWKKEGCRSREGDEIAVAVPMDGFHLYRWQLDQMEVCHSHVRGTEDSLVVLAYVLSGRRTNKECDLCETTQQCSLERNVLVVG